MADFDVTVGHNSEPWCTSRSGYCIFQHMWGLIAFSRLKVCVNSKLQFMVIRKWALLLIAPKQ